MSADPLRIFDALEAPAGWSEPTDLDADPVAAALLDRVLTDTSNVISLDAARRRRRGIAGAVVVAALVTGGAVAAIWNRSPQQVDRVACWSEAAVPPPELVGVDWDGLSDPIDLCSDEWSDGSFEAEIPAPEELQACVTDAEVAAVIPGEAGVCDALGFAEFVQPQPDDLSVAVQQAQRDLDRVFFGSCVEPEPAQREIKQTLAENGLSGWNTTIDGTFSAAEPCATVALDLESTTAYVRPLRGD